MKKSIAVIGAQWGDEGKGKITDYLSKNVDIVVRFQGGSNAGHSVVINGEKTILHLIPSGILTPHVRTVIAPNVCVDLEILENEILKLQKSGVDVTPQRLKISELCPVVLPFHKIIDEQREDIKGITTIGTTRRGISPSYEDRISRYGILLKDLIDIDKFRKKLREILELKNILISYLGGGKISESEILEKQHKIAMNLKDFFTDVPLFLYNEIKNNKRLLFEGAQGTLLDISYGTYPYVTSSNTIAGAIFTGCGLPPSIPLMIVGVVKAYTTRVGKGIFPTEISGKDGELIRIAGGEFGSTTGRPRRCGWLDIPLLRYAKRINGFHYIALTKIDVFEKIENIKVCTEYKNPFMTFPEITPSLLEDKNLFPKYINFGKIPEKISGIKNYIDLGEKTKDYIKLIEEGVGLKTALISTGAERDEIIIRDKEFIFLKF